MLKLFPLFFVFFIQVISKSSQYVRNIITQTADSEKELCTFHTSNLKARPERVTLLFRNVPKIINQGQLGEFTTSEKSQKIDQWMTINPDYLYQFLSQNELYALANEYLEESALHKYNALDWNQYGKYYSRILTLYVHGGLWTGIETAPLKPLHEWKYYPFEDNQVILFATEQHLIMETMISPPFHPLLETFLDSLAESCAKSDHSKQNDQNQKILPCGDSNSSTILLHSLLKLCEIDEKQQHQPDFYWLAMYQSESSALRDCCERYSITIEDEKQYKQQVQVSNYFPFYDKDQKISLNERRISVRSIIRKNDKSYNFFSEEELPFDMRAYNKGNVLKTK